MAVAIDPPNWQDLNLNVVQVDSDAPDNKQAIHEIEEWAIQNEFARTNEYWLRQIVKQDGTRVFRGICYRLNEEVRASNEAILQEISERASKSPRPPAQANDH